MYGCGASMALTYAFAAVEAVVNGADDTQSMALAYDDAVRHEADDVYGESAAMDRLRIYRMRQREIPEWDRAEMERQQLILCVARGALRDPILGRAQLRRTNLLEPPGSVIDDPLVLERARNTQHILARKAQRIDGPTRSELLDLLSATAASAPASTA